jgi:hypothetical protein
VILEEEASRREEELAELQENEGRKGEERNWRQLRCLLSQGMGSFPRIQIYTRILLLHSEWSVRKILMMTSNRMAGHIYSPFDTAACRPSIIFPAVWDNSH